MDKQANGVMLEKYGSLELRISGSREELMDRMPGKRD